MTPSNVIAMPGCEDMVGAPDAGLVNMLRELLASAEDGTLQGFVGAGYNTDGSLTTVCSVMSPGWCIPLMGTLSALSWSLAAKDAEG